MTEEKSPNITFEVRVTPGCAGLDPEAPDWEVLEFEGRSGQKRRQRF
jgi:hypothetical protein